ncbi:MAG: cadmium-translocating P-type ATPase [Bacteroidetes bacterium]|nr:cadmium-translocating P-type ATPase [Bacteroidota bacterium]
MENFIERKIEGMTCGNCALTVTTTLTKLGAKDAVANAATGDVSFTIIGNTPVETFEKGIESLGYTVAHDDEQDDTVKSTGYSEIKILFLISLVLWLPLMLHMFLHFPILHNPWFQWAVCTPVYLINVYYFGKSAFRSLKNGIPNMDVLVFTGASAAYFYSIIGCYLFPQEVHNYLFFETAASIITLVLFGNFLEEYTVSSTAGAIKELMKFQKTKAKLILIDSIGKETIQEVDNKFIRVKDKVLVNSGDKIPVDGIIISGQAQIDESMMSGESLPVTKGTGDAVIGGSIVVDGSIKAEITAVGKNTVISNIIHLVNQAQAAKPPLQKLADKISAVFVPLVIGFALLTFLVNYLFIDKSLQDSMMRTIAVMVIACPCAMGLATPAAVMVGLGRAARTGILIKGGDTLEKFKDIKQFVFDKTGTLTTGQLRVGKFHTSLEESYFKQIVAAIETHSSHPIARSIIKEWTDTSSISFTKVEEEKGIGLHATDENSTIWTIGSYRTVAHLDVKELHDLFILKNKELVGWIDMQDELRDDAADVIQSLNIAGYKTIMLSGDRKEKCEHIAQQLNISEVYSEQLPEQKMAILDKLMQVAPTAMIGDGINDAPSLAKASIGISLSDASQIAIQSANVLLLKNKLGNLPIAIGLGKHTYLTIKQNLFWAFAYNVVAIPVAAAGFLTPTWGAGIMALSDVVLILNSLRLRFKKVV